MNKLVLPDKDGPEFSGTITALIRNNYVVHYLRIAVEKSDSEGQTYKEWERWVYYCPVSENPEFARVVGEWEHKRKEKPCRW